MAPARRIAIPPDSDSVRYRWQKASERNLDLLARYIAGASLVDIGREFGLNPHTVELIVFRFKVPRFRRVDVPRRKPLHITDADFWDWADKSGGKDACWPWQGPLTAHGYGQHRRAWRLANPDKHIRRGWHVMHRCDNPPCVNPRHLRTGSVRMNVDDAIRKGRMGIDFTKRGKAA